MIGEKAVLDDLRAAIRGSLEAIGAAHPGERLNGYALCTDDCLRTLFHAGCTTESCKGDEESELRCVPVDWPYGEGDHLFRRANAELVAHADASEDFSAHVEAAFAFLVDALGGLRNEGVFGDDVLLIVTSTDPGPRLQELADAAVRRLNPPRLFELWKRYM